MSDPDLRTLLPLPTDAWDDALRPVANDMRGRPLNIHQLLAHNTPLLKAWWAFRNHIVSGGVLTPRARELIILRVADALQCDYEWNSHVERGHAAGLSVEEIMRVRTGPGASEWSNAEAALLLAVDDCLKEHRVSPTTLDLLAPHYDHAMVLDIVAIVSLYEMLGTVIGTWGLELDSFIAMPAGYSSDGQVPA